MVTKNCGGRDFPIFVEETRHDCVHACTVADVATVLNFIPAGDYANLAAVVLRQPKRKEEILHPVWGRMVYYANVGRPQGGSTAGPIVILEAVTPDRNWWRGKSMGPADAAEIDRLAADGHQISPTRSRIKIQSSLESTRATQLYRTLPHEIGHLVDYATKAPKANELNGHTLDQQIELEEKFWQRPSQEREAFAHRYADEFRSRMFGSGVFPFSRIESWLEDGLRATDFEWPSVKPAGGFTAS